MLVNVGMSAAPGPDCMDARHHFSAARAAGESARSGVGALVQLASSTEVSGPLAAGAVVAPPRWDEMTAVATSARERAPAAARTQLRVAGARRATVARAGSRSDST